MKKIILLCVLFISTIPAAWADVLRPIRPKLVNGLNQGTTSSCFANAVAAAIEDYYAHFDDSVAISPLHFHFYKYRNSDSDLLQERNLMGSYSGLTIRLVNTYGPFVPDYMLPENLEGSAKNGTPIPPLENMAIYVKDLPAIAYSTESFYIHDRFPFDSSNDNQTLRAIQKLIKSNVVTMGIPASYFQNYFSATFGVRDFSVESRDIAELGMMTDHEVALVGYDEGGFIVRNSWNDKKSVASGEREWKRNTTSPKRAFKQKYFGDEYVHGFYYIPNEDLLRSKFSITVHNFDKDLFKRNYYSYKKYYSKIKAYYHCGNLGDGDEMRRLVAEIKAKPGNWANGFKEYIGSQVRNKFSDFAYATFPIYHDDTGDTYQDQDLVSNFYQNKGKDLDEFYCESKLKDGQSTFRRPYRLNQTNASALSGLMKQLDATTTAEDYFGRWHYILPLMLGENPWNLR